MTDIAIVRELADINAQFGRRLTASDTTDWYYAVCDENGCVFADSFANMQTAVRRASGRLEREAVTIVPGPPDGDAMERLR